MSDPVLVEYTLNAAPAQVWKAITNKDDMKKWYFDLKEFKPEVGFKFNFDVLDTLPKRPEFAEQNFRQGWTHILTALSKNF